MQVDGEEVEQPALVIGFITDSPFTAEEIGRFLIALQKDYMRLYGVPLAVSKVEIGSLWMTLFEWGTWALNGATKIGDLAQSGSRIADFAKRVSDAIRQRSNQVNTTVTEDTETLKMVTEAIKVAGKKNAYFEFYKEDISKDHSRKLLVRMSPDEAQGILKHQKSRRKKRAKAEMTDTALTTGNPFFLTHDSVQREDMSGLLKQLVAPKASADDIRALVDAMVQVLLSNGNLAGLEQMAQAMEDAGKFDIAHQIRAHLPPHNEDWVTQEG